MKDFINIVISLFSAIWLFGVIVVFGMGLCGEHVVKNRFTYYTGYYCSYEFGKYMSKTVEE